MRLLTPLSASCATALLGLMLTACAQTPPVAQPEVPKTTPTAGDQVSPPAATTTATAIPRLDPWKYPVVAASAPAIREALRNSRHRSQYADTAVLGEPTPVYPWEPRAQYSSVWDAVGPRPSYYVVPILDANGKLIVIADIRRDSSIDRTWMDPQRLDEFQAMRDRLRATLGAKAQVRIFECDTYNGLAVGRSQAGEAFTYIGEPLDFAGIGSSAPTGLPNPDAVFTDGAAREAMSQLAAGLKTRGSSSY